jgi:hypothetical protein
MRKKSSQSLISMTKYKFSKMLKVKVRENALIYLTEKQGKKGGKIKYSSLEMAEYLQPFSNELSLEQKRELFSIRNRMNDIPENFPKRDEKYKCISGQIEKITHIYDCEILSKNKQQRVPYEKIFNGNINEQIEVFKLVKQEK